MTAAVASWVRRATVEHGVLFASLLKWTALATLAGVLAGGSTAVFLHMLGLATARAAALPVPPIVLLPLALVTAYLLVHWLAREAEGHGTDKVIEAVHRRWGRIPLLVAPVKLLATIVTIAGGGSVGKEGPAAQIGAALASGLGSALFLRRGDHRRLVICGIGAGFAAVFGTPVAGAVFGVEVLAVGGLFYDVLYPSFVAGIVSYLVARQLGVEYFHEAVATVPTAGTTALFATTLAAGIAFGLVALALIEVLRLATALTRRIPGPRWAVAAGGGLALGALATVTSTRYLGLGLDTVESALHGHTVPAGAFLLKIVFTAISLACGGSGGIVTPIFFVGATAGSSFADLLGLDHALFSAVGMVALLAAATNAPIAAAIMAIELFGAAIGPYAAAAAVVAFLVVGHRSVYGSQILGGVKSGSLMAPVDVEVEQVTRLSRRRRTARHRALVRMLRHRAGRSDRTPGGADAGTTGR